MKEASVNSLSPLARPVMPARARGRKVALRWGGRIALQLVVIILGLVFALPFIWMLSTSLKTDPQVYHVPPIWLPNPLRWANYPEALTYVPFGLYFGNTLKYCLFTTVGVVLSCSICAYGFAKLQWRGRDALFFVLLATMMIPFQVQMIPLYLVFKRLGWLNTYLPLIVPSFFGSAYYIFMLRQFFLTIPNEISDAARIDGAGDVQTLWHVILPLAKPALAVVGLFQFMDAWNDYLGPSIYLRDTSQFPIALGLEQMRAHSMSVNIPLLWPHLMAASAVTILPVVLLYFFTQRTFVEGITVTGIKG
jgi:ABC-type glycerol-3-phosphate transport system permease component